jgi:hypothetical protein
MLIVIGKMAYVRDFISSMTVMTLMTLIYGLILEEGMRRYFVGYPFNLTRRTRRTEQVAPYLCDLRGY